MNTSDQRSALSSALLEQTRAILDEGALNRDRLKKIEVLVSDLADKTQLWGEDDFSNPTEAEKQNRFQIAQESPTGLTLYLNVMRPGKVIPPHDHTTWACVGAVVGAEINTVFNRLDDGSVNGKSELEINRIVDLRPGNALSLMPDDIHSVEIRGTEIIRHLHFYGHPLETLTGRTMYDLDAGTHKSMDIGVKTKAGAAS